jgi:hypothetical protein
MSRLRLGELTALAGIACLLASLFTPWYETRAGNLGLWDTFGGAAALVLIALVVALVMLVAALGERQGPALAVSAAVWCVLFGLIGSIAALVRVLERPHDASGLCAGPWLALAGTLLVFGGAWLVLRDERPMRYPPVDPEPRPRP